MKEFFCRFAGCEAAEGYVIFYGRGFPHSEQNLPVFCAPQAQVQGPSGLGCPQFEQNLPVFCVPQAQVHPPAEAGCI